MSPKWDAARGRSGRPWEAEVEGQSGRLKEAEVGGRSGRLRWEAEVRGRGLFLSLRSRIRQVLDCSPTNKNRKAESQQIAVRRQSGRPKWEAMGSRGGRPHEAEVGGRGGRPKWEAKVGGRARPKWESEVGGSMSPKWEAAGG